MSPTARAALWMTGAIGSFSTMAIAGRAVAADHDTFELMLYRSLVGVVLVSVVASLLGRRGEIRARRMGLHTLRNLSHFAGQNLWFAALSLIPLAQVFALEFSAPIWVLVLSPLLLGEAITRARALAAALGFIGILIVTRPFGAPLSPGILFAGLAAVGFAGSAIFTRKLTRTESVVSVLFWLTAMQALFGLVGAGWDGDIALPTARSAPWLVLIAVAGLGGHLSLTSALRLAPASVVMPIDFARLPLIALVGWLVYGEQLEGAVLLGAALIIGGNLLNLRAEGRRGRRATTPTLAK